MLSDSQIKALAAEMNHLLWVDEPPQATPDTELLKQIPGFTLLPTNMNCHAHMAVCCGLMLRREEKVEQRGGSALVVFPEQAQLEDAHFVAKHYWVTTPKGVCDLSLNPAGYSKHKPIVFENRNIPDPSWKVVCEDDFKTILDASRKTHASRVCGVFYQTDGKLPITWAEFEADSLKTVGSARKRNVPVRFIDIIEHCERLLDGGESYKKIPQEDAWRRLARG